MLEKLRGFYWFPRDEAWDYGFKRLQSYLDKEGRYPTQSYVAEDGFALGRWLNRARNAKELSSERKKLLQSLPSWSFDQRDQRWRAAYDRLVEFVTKTGSAKVPAKYIVDEAFDLGRWVGHMKKSFDSLEQEKKTLLERLPGWSTNYRQDRWNYAYSRLVEFASNEGHSNPTQNYETADGFNLGAWVRKQRNDRTLDRERVQQLELLRGWSWNPEQDRWDHAFEILSKYEAEHGNCAPKDKVRYSGIGLASWVHTQKKRYSKGKLADDRIIQLNSLSSWTW